MIDGIKLQAIVPDFSGWKTATGLQFTVSTFVDTGEIKTKHRAQGDTTKATIYHKATFETYQLTVKETTETGNGYSTTRHLLLIDGSLHKNYQEGSNYKPFTFNDLQAEIEHLCLSLQLSPANLKINRLEIGLNIPFPTAVFPFLKRNLLTYKGHCFSQYRPDSEGKILGYECSGLTQYRAKMYDKALQHSLSIPLMRFELRFLKMEPLKKNGIQTIADLTNFEKVNGLLPLLIRGWQNVVLFDSSINQSNLTASQRQFWQYAGNPKFWESLTNAQYREYKKRLHKIIAKHGDGIHERVKENIVLQWLETCKKFTGIDHVSNCAENQNSPELTIKIKCQKRGTRFKPLI